MHEGIRLLDEARELTGSDRQTALATSVEAQVIANLRAKQYVMNDYLAAQIGELTGIGWRVAVIRANIDRARSDQERDYWRSLLTREQAASNEPGD
ncbi:hypothetical protein [Salinisphaera orenii]|uniref:hypothetical protein n=1 Tax=Salinisphaera orenii TaxID=856731 RepID=UPI000DBE1149